jgi:UDP-N-acetyl-D-galactosamine dehydrogenase
MTITKDTVVAVIGLGYVGLPLAVEFGKKYKTIGFDLSESKISEYQRHRDPTGEIDSTDLKAAMQPNGLKVTTDPIHLASADFLIVAVPTPVDKAHIPDFSALIGASATIGRHMKVGATVIFESTVYPGATEEMCIPVLEKESGLKWKQDFHVGYSPERINPGDKKHTLTRIVKVVSGDTFDTLEYVAKLYESIILAGVHRASSIMVAEAAKVIENTQRDLNIALMNELAMIFDKMNIITTEVLEAAGTKWNFLKFKPGLVGGHCIGVDPYYLTHKAELIGHHPQVILAGRRINDNTAKFVAEKTIKLMIQSKIDIKNAKINILGLTFKENCRDLRNSMVPNLINELASYGVKILVSDPIADRNEAMKEFGLTLTNWRELPKANALIFAVAHDEYKKLDIKSIYEKLTEVNIIVDVKAILNSKSIHKNSIYWSL